MKLSICKFKHKKLLLLILSFLNQITLSNWSFTKQRRRSNYLYYKTCSRIGETFLELKSMKPNHLKYHSPLGDETNHPWIKITKKQSLLRPTELIMSNKIINYWNLVGNPTKSVQLFNQYLITESTLYTLIFTKNSLST